MDPKGTEQQHPEDAIDWSSKEVELVPEPAPTAPAVNDTQIATVHAKVGHTDQNMWPTNTPDKSGLAQKV